MDMTRRGFLKAVLACAAAPAIVKAEILMPVKQLVASDGHPLRSGMIGRVEGFHYYHDAGWWDETLCRKFYSETVFGKIEDTGGEAIIHKDGVQIYIPKKKPQYSALHGRWGR